ncbi:ArnT family glycosyltransferase [Candidatus Omnitrophota bacterium]
MKSGHIQFWEYETIANNILKGAGYGYEYLGILHRAFGPPLYSFLCAFIYYFSNHSYAILLIFQVFLSAMTCVLIFYIANKIFNQKIAILAAILTCIHPGMIIYSAKLHPLTIDIFLFTLAILVLLRAKGEMRARYFILFGIISGICFLSRSTFAIYIPIVFIYLWVLSKDKRKIAFYAGLSVLAMLLVIGPWTIRNYRVLEKLIFVQKSGEVFWRGNNINATGTAYTNGGRPMVESISLEFREKIYSYNEIKQDELFWSEGLKFIKEQPFDFVLLTMKKFYYFWWFSPQSGIEYHKSYLLFYKAVYSFIVLFTIFGIFFALGSNVNSIKENTWLLLLFFLSISLSQSLFYVEGRHRWAIEPLILTLTANGLIQIKYNLRQCLKIKI